MSSQRGNVNRTRAQKHKNRHVFKNDLHDKTPQQTRLNQMNVSTVCQRCKDCIEWKIKYKKYKPLTQPKTCTRCQQRTVRKAYHVICRDCAKATHSCAKCLKSETEVAIEAPEPTPQEEQQLQVEMDRLVKSFSERKRRAFLRYMAKGRKQDPEPQDDDDENPEAREAAKRVAYSRDELLKKIKQLNLSEEDPDDDDDDDEDGEDSDDYDDDDDDDDSNDEDGNSDKQKSNLKLK